jgi:hypothetical protein
LYLFFSGCSTAVGDSGNSRESHVAKPSQTIREKEAVSSAQFGLIRMASFPDWGTWAVLIILQITMTFSFCEEITI